MTFTFPFRPIWFNQLKSPRKKKTKQNRSKHFDNIYKAGRKNKMFFPK